MLDSFLLALGAVAPFLIYLAIGSFVVRVGWTDKPFLERLNTLVFKLLYPIMMFQNVYGITRAGFPSWKLLIYGPVSVIVLVAAVMAAVPRLVRENPRRGAIAQAIFRSNYLLYGVPMTIFVYGEEARGTAGVILAVMVSVFNIAGVIVLETYSGSGHVRFRDLLLKLVKNPLLQGCILGILFFFTGLKLPDFLAAPVSALGNAATPLALITLGGTMEFLSLRKNKTAIAAVLSLKLVILPILFTALAWWIGLRGVELFLTLMIFATPVAVASYPMAVNMGSDEQLAGQLVFTSTIASLLTIFGFIFTMSQMGLL